MEFKSMTRPEITEMLTKTAKTICGKSVLEVCLTPPMRTKADNGTLCEMSVTFTGGIVGTVKFYMKDDAPCFNKMSIRKEDESGELKFKGYVDFGNKFIGADYFRISSMVDGLASLVVACI